MRLLLVVPFGMRLVRRMCCFGLAPVVHVAVAVGLLMLLVVGVAVARAMFRRRLALTFFHAGFWGPPAD